MTLRDILCKALIVAFATIALSSQATEDGELQVHPSRKYPDYPFSEAVSYGGVPYLFGDIGTGSDGTLVGVWSRGS